MNEQTARKLVAFLNAAFPNPRIPQSTIELYVAELRRLDDVAAATATVQEAVRNADWLPPIAGLLRVYREHARRNADELARRRGLDEPPPDPANLERARSYLRRLKTGDNEAA